MVKELDDAWKASPGLRWAMSILAGVLTALVLSVIAGGMAVHADVQIIKHDVPEIDDKIEYVMIEQKVMRSELDKISVKVEDLRSR